MCSIRGQLSLPNRVRNKQTGQGVEKAGSPKLKGDSATTGSLE